jgi:phage gp36-like protein
MLANLARNKRLAPQIREKVVDGLTQVAASGNGNAAVAADALLELAKFPNDPIGKKALANITSMKNTDMMDQGKLNEVLQNAATSNKTDVPMKKTAQMMLENSAKANPFNTKKQSGQNNNPNEGNNIFLNIDTNQQQARSVEQKQNKTLFSSASPNKGAMPRAEYNPFMVA